MIFIGNFARSQDLTKNPNEVLLEACDTALNDQVELNKAQQELVNQLKIAASVKQERIDQLQKDQGAWYNRTELMLFIGLTAGLIAGGLIAK